VKINVKMFDDTPRGSHIDHGATVVVANASGTTTLRHAFIPPCNTTGQSTSNYSIAVEAQGSHKQINFGRYDSAARRVFK
jgi:ssDNA-binding replication factor A large subunit